MRYRPSLCEELRLLAFCPRIVVCGEDGAALDGGMVVGPEFDKRAEVGIVKIGCAEVVEGCDGGFLRVGDDAVDRFLAVDVGFVLDVAADEVGGWLGDGL